MKTKILFLAIVISGVCNAQTKIIAHKSHSGSNHSFTKAYQQNMFDIRYSNFGNPMYFIHILDTVQVINESTVLLKYRTSKTCHSPGTKYNDIRPDSFESRCDTLVNHPLFDNKNTFESIKTQLSEHFYYSNTIETILFIGFNIKSQTQPASNQPASRPKKPNKPRWL